MGPRITAINKPTGLAVLLRIAIFAVPLFYISSPAFAWSALGHKVVAEIAWEQLTLEQRQPIVDTLRRHPRFDKDFAGKMDDNALTGEKSIEDHWIFLQAAIWPDIIRKDKEFDRPTWHYIDFPLFLEPADRQLFAGRPPVNLATDYPTRLPESQYNVLQAIAHCEAALKTKAGPETKSIVYCWLFHLLGDIHQPLHCTALFNVERLSKGDKGGNEILLKRGKNLHSAWDNLLGRDSYLRDVDKAALELSDKTKYGDVWASAAKESDPRKWAAESHDLAESVVYDAAILAAIRQSPPGDKLPPIDLPEEYYRAAGELARKRVLAAGLRLADLLQHSAEEPGSESKRLKIKARRSAASP